jgi:hypothetical protein
MDSILKYYKIIILIIILIIIYRYIFHIDTFISINTIQDNYIDKLLGYDKNITLKTTFNGIEYKLASIHKSLCFSYDTMNNCISNILVLIQTDNNKIPKESSNFSLIKVEKNNTKSNLNSYKLIGNVKHHDNSFIKHSVSMAGEFTLLSYACLDGSTLGNDPFSTIEIIRIPNKENNNRKYIIRLAHHELIGNKYILHNKHGVPHLNYKYIGLCKDENCKIDDDNMYRLCLYDHETNPFVLQFEFDLVN